MYKNRGRVQIYVTLISFIKYYLVMSGGGLQNLPGLNHYLHIKRSVRGHREALHHRAAASQLSLK